MDSYRIAAAVVVAFLGLCFLAGAFKNLRERIYLGLLGLSFLAFAGALLVPSPELKWLKWGLLALTAVLFVGAAVFAVARTLSQVRLIQQRRAGLEREMWEYLRQLEQKAAEQESEEAAGGGEQDSGPASDEDKREA